MNDSNKRLIAPEPYGKAKSSVSNESMRVYFDNAASTKVRDEAIDAMVSVMKDTYGNPSSMHGLAGRHVRSLRARVRV